MRESFLSEFNRRNYFNQCTNSEELEKLMNAKKIRAYIGFDCTAPSLHVGSLLQIMCLRNIGVLLPYWQGKIGRKCLRQSLSGSASRRLARQMTSKATDSSSVHMSMRRSLWMILGRDCSLSANMSAKIRIDDLLRPSSLRLFSRKHRANLGLVPLKRCGSHNSCIRDYSLAGPNRLD